MRKALIWISMVLLLPLAIFAAPSADKAGAHQFVRGDLGFVDPADELDLTKSADSEAYRLSVTNFLDGLATEKLGATGVESFEAYRVRHDDLGKVHTRFDQYLHGLQVVGAQMIVHADAKTGQVEAVNGAFARGAGVPSPMAAYKRGFNGKVPGEQVGEPQLVYFHDAQTGKTHLTWQVRSRGVENGEFFDTIFFTDFRTGNIVGADPLVHTAKVRATYDGSDAYLNAQGGISGLPGDLACNESNTNCNDASAQRAHDGAGDVYDYYQARFGRNGINDAGMTMVSSVHVDDNWPNAAWYANQMVYGDGDGSTLDDLTKSFDVIAHELTHGVTDYESDLIYANESGALNEALSDIFGVAADAYATGSINSSTWKLGEEVYTPGTSGDALRYMNDPTLDGYSRDHYSTRLYPNNCSPSSNNDNCGVHGNSGIANLAFYLMVQGGLHPDSGVSPRPNVPAIGMAKAEQIFYRAQTTYLTSSSTFAAARTATVNSAGDLYGSTEVTAVETAWCAVGVGSCPSGGGGGELDNGVAESAAGSQGSSTYFTIDIPAGATNLQVTTSGGSGDPDLYVRFGSQPTTGTYDCRSWNSGPSESCTFASPSTGTYHVLIYGYSTYSGLSVTASWTEPSGGGGGGELSNGVPETGLSGSSGSTTYFTIDVPSGASNLSIAMSGGSGDADLYVRFGSQPTTSTYDCRPYKNGNNETCDFATPSAGTYHVMIRGYSAYSSVSLVASFDEPSGSCGNSGSASNLSGGSGSTANYTWDVPACASSVTISISGGSGDADLYVRFGSAPTTSTFDCRPYLSGNNETCTFDPSQTGTYHIMVRGYSSYSGVTLTAEHE